MKLFTTGTLLIMSLAGMAVEMPVVTGELFPDTDGAHVNAHGGGIMKHDGVYYWYGEHRDNGQPGSYQRGVACYTSPDLKTWTNRGIVMEVSETPGDPIEKGCIIERPKVVYNPATQRFVLWFHHEMKGVGYGSAYAGVAVADNPLGPFKLLHTGRVNPGVYPQGIAEDAKSLKWDEKMEWWTPQWRKAIEEGMFNLRDLDGGQMSRDMTVYVDDDGKAYHIYSSESNLTIQIAELDPTYTRHTGRYVRLFPGGHNEAPAIFKKDGVYWMITSGCTGWDPNAARLMRATSIMGPWELLPNPCRGEGAEITFGGQSTYIFKDDRGFTFMADIWNPKQKSDSRHLWLPIKFGDDGVPYIEKPEK